MATLTKRGSGTPATTGTAWANATAAFVSDGTVGTNPASYATMTSTVSGAVATIEVSGYDFASGIAAPDTLNSVTVALRHLENVTGRFASVTYQAFDGATAIGTAQTATLVTAAATASATFPATLAQLRSATFKIRVTITGAGSTQSRIFSLDQIDVTADYTVLVYPFPTTGLVGWYDAADASVFSYSSGVNVSQWRDKSPGVRHLTGPGTSAAARNGSVNGLTTVVVANETGACTVGTPIMTVTDNWAMFVVARRTGGSAESIAFMNGDGYANGYGIASRGASGTYSYLAGGIAWNQSSLADNGDRHVHTLTRTSGVYGHYVDGVATNINGQTFWAPNTPSASTSFPASIAPHAFAGDVCEAVVYNVAVSATDRQAVEDYLRSKWLPPRPIGERMRFVSQAAQRSSVM